jgi:GT2 family glycosyltransferase
VAVVVTRGRSEYLPRALVALAGQSLQPQSVIVVDAGAKADPAIAEMAIRCGVPRAALSVVHAVRAKNFGQAVAAGLSGRSLAGLIWLLHDDSYAAPDCLANLVARLEMSPSVAVAGPKQVQAQDPSRLGEVGVTTTPFGRRIPYGQDGELDQGQYDRLEDVLAVGSAGMLVRGEVWQALSGFTPALGPFRDGLDFSRRARLAGHRVVVEPAAVIEHEQAAYRGLREPGRRRGRGRAADDVGPGEAQAADDVGTGRGSAADGARRRGRGRAASTARSYGARRRAFIFTALAEAPLWALIPVAVLAVAVAIGRCGWRLAAKDFRLAVDELWAPIAVLTRFDAVARARYVAGRTRRLPRRRLAPLQISAAEARQARRDRRVSDAELRRQALAPTEIEMAEQRQLASRRRRMLTAVMLVVTAVSGLALYRLIGPGALTGGALGLQDASAWELAGRVGGGWLTQGLGQPGPGDPFDAVLAVATLICLGHGATAVKLLLLTAPLVAALGAWFAAGAASRSVWLRAWAALFYWAAPSLWLAVSDGRVGAAVAHAALPWAMLGVARAIGVNRLDVRPAVIGGAVAPAAARGSLAAAAFAGLALATAGAGSPALLAPALLALVVVFALAGRGRRGRLIWVALPALALFAPAIWAARADGAWRALLTDPGPALGYEQSPFWLAWLGWPTPPQDAWFLPDQWALVGAAALTGGAVVAATLALFRRGPAGRAVRFGWFLALAAGVAVFGLERLAVSVDGLEAVPAWTGGVCALAAAGWLAAGAAGLSGLVGERQRTAAGGRQSAGGRQTASAALATLGLVALLAGPALTSAVDAWQRLHQSDVRRTATNPMPPIVVAESASAMATYALVAETVGAGADGALTWEIVRGAGRQVTASAGLEGGRRLSGLPGAVAGPDAADRAVGRVLAGIAARNPGAAAAELAGFGIGFILVGDDPALAAAMDATPGLTRVREGDEGAVVWRVAPADLQLEGLSVDAAARLHLVSPGSAASQSDAVALDSGSGADIRVELPDGADGRRLVLAERADSRWRATLDGQPLAAVAGDDWRQVFEVPAGAGQLRVWYQADWRFALAQAVVLALAALLSLPIRRQAGAREES